MSKRIWYGDGQHRAPYLGGQLEQIRANRTLHVEHTMLIGIDTGVDTGICIYLRRAKKIHALSTVKIHVAMRWVTELIADGIDPNVIFVRVEDARLRKLIPQGKNEKAERGRAAGAGSVKRDAIIWEDFLTDIGVSFEMVAPKDNKTKMNAVFFKRLTGYTGSTTSHARDAAALVFGY